MRRLPSLASLAAFEAVAIRGGVAAAGQDLCLTPGAVSKHVLSLERWLGRPLFDRSGRALVMTPAGGAFLREVTAALDRLELANARFRAESELDVLRVSAPPTFMMYWLIPRLGDFQRQHPEIRVQLDNRRDRARALPEGTDVAIRRGPAVWDGLQSIEFMPEALSPVCAPTMIGRDIIVTPADLARHPRLVAGLRPLDWADWLQAAQLPDLPSQGLVQFDHTFLALEAAMDGLGVAMGPLFLIGRDLHERRLEQLFEPISAPSPGYFAVCAPDRSHEPSVTALTSWLIEQGRVHARKVVSMVDRSG
jgi:LysR family transcriptional regulator, glycine cleavage system transcriptional activator